MTNKFDNKTLNYLQTTVHENILRRTFATANTIINDDIIQYNLSKTNIHNATKNAFHVLKDWLLENHKNIDGICFYGSTTNNAIVNETMVVPKVAGKYQSNTFLVGPSDIDFILFINTESIGLPSYVTEYISYDISNLTFVSKSIDLFDSISVFHTNRFIEELNSDTFVLPMYLRFLINDGHWYRDGAQIKETLLASFDKTNYWDKAIKFYSLRVNNLTEIYKKIIKQKLTINSIYGTSYSP